MVFEGFKGVRSVFKGVQGVWNPKTRRGVSLNNSTSTMARGSSNLRATAHSATGPQVRPGNPRPEVDLHARAARVRVRDLRREPVL